MRQHVFIAIVAFTGEVTFDNRVLMTPRGAIRTGDYPLPVRAMVNGSIRQVGYIEQAAVCDRRLIIFGKFFPGKTTVSDLVSYLRSGACDFEIDVDQAAAEFDGDTIRLTDWRLRAVTIGCNPCWRLPRPQIEELDVKEKIDV